MAIYMKFGSIVGEVTAKGYEEYIQLESAGFGCSRPSYVESGAGQGKRHTDAVTVSDVQISRTCDKASPLLFKEACGGTPIPEVSIQFTKTEKEDLVTYMEYKLKNVLITSYSNSGGNAGGSESMALNFTHIFYGLTPFNPDGSKGETIKGIFDVEKAQRG